MILCEPAERVEVVRVATPALKLPVPIWVVPSKNDTDPVALPAPGAVAATVAVKVTDWPKTEALVVAKVVVVLA